MRISYFELHSAGMRLGSSLITAANHIVARQSFSFLSGHNRIHFSSTYLIYIEPEMLSPEIKLRVIYDLHKQAILLEISIAQQKPRIKKRAPQDW